VTGQRESSLAGATASADARPGNVSVVPAAEFEDRLAVTLRDMLGLTPGVIAQPRFGEEVRLSIRGSGVANNSHLRGVELSFDGVAINGADGFGDFQEIDPNFVAHLTVLRGANAFSGGSPTLGGAIEMSAIRGDEAGEAAILRIDAGTAGTVRLHARAAIASERGDALAAVTLQRADGWRENAAQSNGRLLLTGGWRLGPRVDTRFGLLGTDLNQQIPGALTISDALATPRRANPGNAAFAFARDINSWRGWTSTSVESDRLGRLLVGTAYSDRQLYHPISVVIDQRLHDGQGFARWDHASTFAGVDLGWTVGVRVRDSRTAARTFAAVRDGRAARGALTAHSIQRAGGINLLGEVRVGMAPGLEVLAGAVAIETRREVQNLRNPAASDSMVYRRTVPRLGVIWTPDDDTRVFANLSGVYEPPGFGQLTQGGLSDFVPIQAQRGTSAEVGARTKVGPVGLDVTVYRVQLRDEFIAFQTSPLIPAVTFNAPRTKRNGIEAGARATLAEDFAGARLEGRLAWTWNDFRFDADPIYGDNRLAGVPDHTLAAELALEGQGWRVAPSVLVQSDLRVDFANTLKAPGAALWNLSASRDITERATIYVDARNLSDEAAISMVSTIADARAPRANLAVATPGDGRAVFAGLRLRFGARP